MPDVVQTQGNLILSRILGWRNDHTYFIDKEAQRTTVAKMELELTAGLKDLENCPPLCPFGPCKTLNRMPEFWFHLLLAM